ncbi:MAG: hypothetical protein Q8O89_00590, partial [Nanoarchaeota archaeon]|nr:hypothetical protein [Nanoarchaeota archaeon]
IAICIEPPEEVFQRLYTTHNIYQYTNVRAPVDKYLRYGQGLVIVEFPGDTNTISKLDDLNLQAWERSDKPAENNIIDALYEVARCDLTGGKECHNAPARAIIEKSNNPKYAGLIADMLEVARITLGINSLEDLKTTLYHSGTEGLCQVMSEKKM